MPPEVRPGKLGAPLVLWRVPVGSGLPLAIIKPYTKKTEEPMYCNVNGLQLYYTPPGPRPPLLLLHGNGETHQLFDALIPPPAQHYTVYALDSRGHGQARPPRWPTTQWPGDVYASLYRRFPWRLSTWWLFRRRLCWACWLPWAIRAPLPKWHCWA